MQYCFDIKNPDSAEIDSVALRIFVSSLYEDEFKDNKKGLPYVTIYSENEKSVCIVLTSKGKKNLEKVQSVNDSLQPSQLKFGKIRLSKPYEFKVDSCRWWSEGGKEIKEGRKWESMIHNGPYFKDIMEPYEALGAYLTYDGKKYPLTAKEERVASFYANRLISEMSPSITIYHTKNPVFNNNFFKDFKEYLTPEHKKIFKDFKKIGWKDLVRKLEHDKESKKEETGRAKKRKERTEMLKMEHAYATLDGNREKLGNFIVEPMSIYMGRGNNPNMGRIKREIVPEDVTINIGINDPIPKPPNGYEWGEVTHDHHSEWVAKWKDSITGKPKYLRFSDEGKFKGENDLEKYEYARKLDLHINKLRDAYMKDVRKGNNINKQLATAIYLIDHFGIRVGGEKDEGETDTTGVSTLRVEHVRIKPPDKIVLDFLGKDSIRYYKELNVDKEVYKNIKEFLQAKNKKQNLFNMISAKTINEYLKKFDKDFSAKLFRTRLASTQMFYALQDVNIPGGSTKARTKVLFGKANKVVAETLNHAKTISKKSQEDVVKLKEKLKKLKEERKDLVSKGKSTKSKDKSIDSTKNKIEEKSDTMNVAMSTSLTNYIDPRVIVSWAKQQEIELDYVYTPKLMKKFQWAIECTDEEWDYITSKLSVNKNMTGKIAGSKSKPKEKTKRKQIYVEKMNLSSLPGTIEEWNILLSICTSPEKNRKLLINVSKPTLNVVRQFSEYFQNDLKANEYIIKYWERAYGGDE